MAQITLNSTGVASSGSLVLQSNGTTSALTIDTAQNAGLGVTPSAFVLSGFRSLEIGGVGSSIFAGANDQNALVNAYYNSGWKYAGTGVATRYQMNSGEHRWYNAASGTAGNAITFTQAMTLDASGNLGVGTTSPNIGGLTRALTLNTPTGGNYSGVELAGAGTLSARFITNNAAGTFIGSQVSIPLIFETNATERARIDSSGNLLVGMTSTTGTGLALRPQAGGGFFNSRQSGTTTAYHFYFTNGNGDVGSITTSGSTTTFNTSSDYRLKNITGSLTGYKERLSALQPKQGSWKADGSEFRGFLAHEFAVSYPASVNGEKDAVDADGNPQYQGMQAGSSEVIADLVAYIKELETRLSALEA